jgi:hypothetical protein
VRTIHTHTHTQSVPLNKKKRGGTLAKVTKEKKKTDIFDYHWWRESEVNDQGIRKGGRDCGERQQEAAEEVSEQNGHHQDISQ